MSPERRSFQEAIGTTGGGCPRCVYIGDARTGEVPVVALRGGGLFVVDLTA